MNNKIPTITISLKKPTIRIYKETLYLIGNPTHILLLVNPQECTLVISPSANSDVKAHNVAKYMKKNSKSVELYSTSLINALKALCPEWKSEGVYKFYGALHAKEYVVKFNMTEGLAITKQER